MNWRIEIPTKNEEFSPNILSDIIGMRFLIFLLIAVLSQSTLHALPTLEEFLGIIKPLEKSILSCNVYEGPSLNSTEDKGSLYSHKSSRGGMIHFELLSGAKFAVNITNELIQKNLKEFTEQEFTVYSIQLPNTKNRNSTNFRFSIGNTHARELKVEGFSKGVQLGIQCDRSNP